jgi:signal transduction histidine kinase
MIDVLVEEKNKAMEADKRKSVFLANMSHEIRTPLNAIVGFSELLTDVDDKELRSQYIDIINQNNVSLLRIVSDILDLSKIESGAVEFHSDAFDLADLYRSLYGGMRDLCTSPDVEFRGINPYKKCIVALDKSRVSQVWTKYIENAIKYTKKGYVLMGYEQVNGGIRIYTKDTGIGIPDNKRSVVYQRFEKFDNFSKGTGLGLAICKAIVIRLNGNVGFESEDGKGSTFWAWIPCTAEIVNK